MKTARVLPPLVAAALLLLARSASAEVSLVKNDGWEVFTTGRINGFVVHGWGDANPLALSPGETIIPGGGLDVGSDSIPSGTTDPVTGAPTQGTFNNYRIRSGFLPNVLAFGLRTQISENVKLLAYVGVWTTIGTEKQRKTGLSAPDVREGYLKVEGPWGSVLVGRALDLFSRGATENDFLYGHGYAVGYPGNIDNNTTTNGLIGFGVLAAFFEPGVVYTTPQALGFQLGVGAYDPVTVVGDYEATRYPLAESELTWDGGNGQFKLHLFGNTAFQKFYQPAVSPGVSAWGFGYGGRLEVGLFHLGVAGHYGKGLGMYYAFQSDATSFSQQREARTFDGYSAFMQFVLGHFDLNLSAGISRVFLLPSEEDNTTTSLIKRQIGYSGVVVYHWSPHLHSSLEYMRGDFAWFLGEKQKVNFVSAGLTATW